MGAPARKIRATAARAALAADHLGLARREANRIARRLPTFLDRDDLFAAAYVGLAEAAAAFREDGGAAFMTFAKRRIQGALLDHLRAIDPMPRDTRRFAKELAVAETRLGRGAGDEALREALGWSERRYERVVRARWTTRPADAMFTPSDSGSTDNDPGKFDREVPVEGGAAAAEARLDVERLLGELPDRHAGVLRDLYLRGLTLRVIAGGLRITESRTCQIANEALEILREAVRRPPAARLRLPPRRHPPGAKPGE